MSRIEEVLFEDVLRQVRRVHRSSMAAKGFNVDTAITRPTGCVFGDWRDIGTHVFIGPGQGRRNVYADVAKPIADLDISLVNEAWGAGAGMGGSVSEQCGEGAVSPVPSGEAGVDGCTIS